MKTVFILKALIYLMVFCAPSLACANWQHQQGNGFSCFDGDPINFYDPFGFQVAPVPVTPPPANPPFQIIQGGKAVQTVAQPSWWAGALGFLGVAMVTINPSMGPHDPGPWNLPPLGEGVAKPQPAPAPKKDDQDDERSRVLIVNFGLDESMSQFGHWQVILYELAMLEEIQNVSLFCCKTFNDSCDVKFLFKQHQEFLPTASNGDYWSVGQLLVNPDYNILHDNFNELSGPRHIPVVITDKLIYLKEGVDDLSPASGLATTFGILIEFQLLRFYQEVFSHEFGHHMGIYNHYGPPGNLMADGRKGYRVMRLPDKRYCETLEKFSSQ